MSSEPSRLNGIIVSATLSWARSAYGDDLVERALIQLPAEDRASLKKLVVSIGWYDISLHEKFLELCYQEVSKKTGESREHFDRRGIEEGGGAILNNVYKFIFSLMQPSSILSRVSTLFKRNYSNGSIRVIENRPGYCILQFDIPNDMREHLLRQNPIGYKHLLKLSGAKDIKVTNTETVSENGCQLRMELEYQ